MSSEEINPESRDEKLRVIRAYVVHEQITQGLLESIRFHKGVSVERGLDKPHSNYGSRTVADSYDRFGLSPMEARNVLALLRLDGYVRYSEDVLPGLELTSHGEALFEELSARSAAEDEFE